MRKPLRLHCTIYGIVFLLGSCASHKPVTPKDENNPMPGIWTSIMDRMDRLERTHANRAEWTKAASMTQQVTSLAQFHAALKSFNFKPSELQRLDSLFHKSRHIVLFDFEEGFRAFVFLSG